MSRDDSSQSNFRLARKRFPRTSQYAVGWLTENPFGSNCLWLAEWLCEVVHLQPGMRVLDLGCGRAKSSIFMAREFDVQVWATDLWISPEENWQRVRDAGMDAQVFPIHADARALPFAPEFFDVIVSVDSFHYYGTDATFLNSIARFLRLDGTIGFASTGLVNDFDDGLPDHLRKLWTAGSWTIKTANWWRQHWLQTGLVDIKLADTMPDGWKYWLEWAELIDKLEPNINSAIHRNALLQDQGHHLGYVRLVATRNPSTNLDESCWSNNLRHLPVQYERRPLIQ